MFLNTLRRFRPETSIFLTAAAIIIGSACAPSDDNNTNPIVNPTGGTVGGTGVGGTTAGTAVQGGTTGGTATAGGTTSGTATAGGTTSGTATAGGTTSGTATAGGTTSGTATAGGTTSGTATAGGTTSGTAGGTVSGASDAGVSDGGAGGGTMGGGMVMNFPGAYKGCTSYGKASGTGDAKKCTSWYCNVTLGQMKTAYVMGAGPCANNGPEQTCDNTIANDVGKCARDIKSGMPLASNDALRPMINDCVRKKDPTNYSTTKLTDACLKCFVDVAQCAGDNCLFECLTGDSADCDNCRIKNKCDQPVFKCGGVPDVF